MLRRRINQALYQGSGYTNPHSPEFMRSHIDDLLNHERMACGMRECKKTDTKSFILWANKRREG